MEIFKIIETLPLSFRGEYEITDAMNIFLEKGKKIKNFSCDEFIDSGTPEGLFKMMEFILKKNPSLFSNDSSHIVQPVFIGKNCKIGKNVSIGPM